MECDRRGDEWRIEAVRPVLERLGRRWFIDVEALVAGLMRLARWSPPTQLLTAVLKAWLYVWCTTSRNNHTIAPCRRCRVHGGDSQMHDLACEVALRWMRGRSRLCDILGVDVAHTTSLAAFGSRRPSAIKVAPAIGANMFDLDSKRHGATQSPITILDARLKERRRRHGSFRSWPIGMLGWSM